jgi:hypothetical protein
VNGACGTQQSDNVHRILLVKSEGKSRRERSRHRREGRHKRILENRM